MRIEAKNLVKIYGDRSVVNDVSFEVNKGEVVCLLGPNGAGKTTTFYMVVGLVKPNRGQVLLDGFSVTRLRSESALSLSRGERRRAELARALAPSPYFL